MLLALVLSYYIFAATSFETLLLGLQSSGYELLANAGVTAFYLASPDLIDHVDIS